MTEVLKGIKENVYKMAVTPAMMYGLEMMALTEGRKVELKMFRFALGVTRMARIRNKHIRRTAQVAEQFYRQS